MADQLAPILIFTYNRPRHTKEMLKALSKNNLASASELIIYADGPKPGASEADRLKITEVREIIKKQTWCKKLTVNTSEVNLGLADSIIHGVTATLKMHDRVIVLEDDLITSPYFLQYMNQALDLYENHEQVVSVHGYVYPVKEKLPETFFLKGADCWGWATWKRGWDIFEPDGQKLLSRLQENDLVKEFDYDNTYAFTKMLADQIKGKNNSWAVRWQAAAFIKGKLTLYPGRSLVKNIGNDGSGVHSGKATVFDVRLSDTPVTVTGIPVMVNTKSRMAFVKYFNSIKPGFLTKVYYKLKSMIKNAAK